MWSILVSLLLAGSFDKNHDCSLSIRGYQKKGLYDMEPIAGVNAIQAYIM